MPWMLDVTRRACLSEHKGSAVADAFRDGFQEKGLHRQLGAVCENYNPGTPLRTIGQAGLHTHACQMQFKAAAPCRLQYAEPLPEVRQPSRSGGSSGSSLPTGSDSSAAAALCSACADRLA